MKTYEFKTIKEARESGIKFGDQWFFTGYPEPPVDEVTEKWVAQMEKADRLYSRIEETVNEMVKEVNDDGGGKRN